MSSLSTSTPDEWFNHLLDQYQAGTLPTGKLFNMGRTPHLPFPGWLSGVPVAAGQNIARKFADKHRLDLPALRDFPSRLRAPMAIFASDGEGDLTSRFVVVTDLILDQRPVVAIYVPVKHPTLGDYFTVASIYAKDTRALANWEAKGLLRYRDKTKNYPDST